MNKSAVTICKRVGLRGILKSAYNSLGHTGTTHRLILGPHTITEIDREASIYISSYFVFESINKGTSHINLGRSKLAVDPGGSVTVPPTTGATQIGPCSVLHVEGDFITGRSYINSHSRIIGDDHIRIGDDCAIAWNLEMIDTDRHQLILEGRLQDTIAPIKIQYNV